MRHSGWVFVVCLFSMAFAGSVAHGQCDPGGGLGGVGPDVIVGVLTGPDSYGNAGGYYAYSCGTTSCNIGTEELLWFANNPNHPVIAQNMYRLKDGRFQMIGMSWLKHGFTALNENLCGTCSPTPGTTLGVGCSDPYTSGLNGSQGLLGPRSQVNATTGFFTLFLACVSSVQFGGHSCRVVSDGVDPFGFFFGINNLTLRPGVIFWAATGQEWKAVFQFHLLHSATYTYFAASGLRWENGKRELWSCPHSVDRC